MAKYERGIYEPSDDAAYDGAEDDDEEGGSRLPLLIFIMLIVVAAFLGVVYLAYTQGVERGRTETPRVIGAPAGPERTAPSGETGSATQFKGLKVYEQPAPTDEELDAETTPPPTPVTKAPPPPTEKAPVVKTEVAKTPPATKAPVVKAQVEKTPAATPPAANAVATKKPAALNSFAVLNKTPATAAPTPLAAAPVAAAGGGYVLQVGAYKSEDDAQAAWRAYKAKHAAASGYSPDVKRVDLGDKGVWFRLRIGPFAGKDEAAGVCDKLKADGALCFPTKS